MRVSFLITRSDDIGGAQIHIRDLSMALKARGHDVMVLAGANGALADQLGERGVPFYALSHLARAVGPLQDVRAFMEIRQALRDLRPDLVSTHSTKAGFLGRIAGKTLGIPTLFTAHGWGFTEGRSDLQRFLFWAIERVAAPLAARIITVCESDREAAIRSRLTRDDRLVTVYNAMPDIDGTLRGRPAVSPPRLVMVARLSSWKDHPTLLRALSGLKDLSWELEFVGDGPLRAQLQALAGSLNLASRVNFRGFCADVSERLAEAQLFLLTSKWEGFPRSILEAMRAGLPVIASGVGGVRESVVDGQTGFVVPRGDVELVRDRLRRLIADAELRVRMGEAGRARYEERFMLERLVEQTTAVYKSVLGRI